MTAVDRLLAALRSRGCEPQRSGSDWSCRCPAHDDQRASLSISTGEDGRALLHCHAGCAADAVCAAVGLSVADLFAPGTNGGNGRAHARNAPRATTACPTPDAAIVGLERRRGRPAATWTYHDAAGEPVGMVARWDGPNGKTIRPVSHTPAGWIIRAMPAPRPLYGLPELRATTPGDRVYVTEGEKAADAARALGLVATTSAGGARAAAQSDWSPLAERDVVILPDHDDAGEKYAADVARLARAAGARSVRVVRLAGLSPDLPPGGDVADVVARAGNAPDSLAALRSEIERLADATEPENATPAPTGGAAIVTRLADVTPEPISWLWPDRIALGKLTLLAGDPGLGKSFLSLDVAARVSTGAGWPDRPGEGFEPGGVVLLSAEDDLADTIRPRLDAAGADCARIVALTAVGAASDPERGAVRPFDLGRDLPALEAAIRKVDDCRLVVIDPITAYLGRTDSHVNAEVRGLLGPLADLAARHRVAVVAVTHLNKSGNGPAIYRAMGSLAFAAAARAVWSVSRDKGDPDRRLFLPVKNNIAPDAGGLGYRIKPGREGGCPVVEWEPDRVDLSADDALSVDRGGGDGRTERDDAADWLRELLADGPRPARDVLAHAIAAGFSKRTIDRAKPIARVRVRKETFGGGWQWELVAPEGCQPAPEGCHIPDVGNLRENPAKNPEFPSKVATSEGMATFGGDLGESPDRAKAAIGVLSVKDAFGGPWQWALRPPAEDAQAPKMRTEDAHTPDVAHLRAKQGVFFENPPKVRNLAGVRIFGGDLGESPGLQGMP